MSKHDKEKVKVRRSWGDLDPATKIHKDKNKYNRSQAKKEIETALDDDASDDNFKETYNE